MIFPKTILLLSTTPSHYSHTHENRNGLRVSLVNYLLDSNVFTIYLLLITFYDVPKHNFVKNFVIWSHSSKNPYLVIYEFHLQPLLPFSLSLLMDTFVDVGDGETPEERKRVSLE